MLSVLLSACASQSSQNPSQAQVLTLVAGAMGDATQTIPPPYFTFEEETYADQISHSTANLIVVLEDFDEHRAMLDDDPNAFDDKMWRADMMEILENVKDAGTRVGDIQPVPDIFVGLHPLLLELDRATTKLVDDYSAYVMQGEAEKGSLAQENERAVRDLLHQIAVALRQITFDAFSQ